MKKDRSLPAVCVAAHDRQLIEAFRAFVSSLRKMIEIMQEYKLDKKNSEGSSLLEKLLSQNDSVELILKPYFYSYFGEVYFKQVEEK